MADALGLTKQALLHHFASKEKLYGEVLEGISHELDRVLATAQSPGQPPVEQLRHFFLAMVPTTTEEIVRARLLMRELLDNKHRAETAGTWYLKPFLETLMTMAKALPGWRTASDAEALALIYQLLGAVTYYGVSGPTLQGIFSQPSYRALQKSFPRQLDTLLSVALVHPPAQND